MFDTLHQRWHQFAAVPPGQRFQAHFARRQQTRPRGLHQKILAIGAGVLWRQAVRLNLLALGEEQAFQLGVEAERVKRTVFVIASLITGAAISAAGSIGFVGLIVPHAARFLLGPDNRRLVAAVALLGASFLMLADLLARIVMAPAELPVGVITSFCGAPLFVYLLRSRRGGGLP